MILIISCQSKIDKRINSSLNEHLTQSDSITSILIVKYNPSSNACSRAIEIKNKELIFHTCNKKSIFKFRDSVRKSNIIDGGFSYKYNNENISYRDISTIKLNDYLMMKNIINNLTNYHPFKHSYTVSIRTLTDSVITIRFDDVEAEDMTHLNSLYKIRAAFAIMEEINEKQD